MVRSYGYSPSSGTGGEHAAKPTPLTTRRYGSMLRAVPAVVEETKDTVVHPKPEKTTKQAPRPRRSTPRALASVATAQTINRPEATPQPPIAEAAQKPNMTSAVGVALTHVRTGAPIPKDLAEWLQADEKSRSEIIYRVGQAFGPLGLGGQELADAQNRLANFSETVAPQEEMPEAEQA